MYAYRVILQLDFILSKKGFIVINKELKKLLIDSIMLIEALYFYIMKGRFCFH